MAKTAYRDLAEFGLPLVTPTQPAFASLARDIERQHEEVGPWPFGPWPVDDLNNSAVLLNESGNAVLGVSYFWRYTTATGNGWTSYHSNLLGASSTQLEVLTGRSNAVSDLGTFIVPGSKRLFTESGMFGNNLDVLDQSVGGGWIGAGHWGFRPGEKKDIVSVELALDLAILEDGRCVGLDETGFFDSLIEDLEHIRRTAQEAAMILRRSASTGEVVEMLRGLAWPIYGPTTQQRMRPHFLRMFGIMGMDKLANADPQRGASWLEKLAQPTRLNLYRAS